MQGLAILLLTGLLISGLAVILWTAYLLSHPPRRTYASALSRSRPGDPSEIPGNSRAWSEWHFTSRGTRFAAWDMAGDSPAGPVIIFTHGWGDSRIGALTRMVRLAPMASRLIAWDMAGHGETPGTSTLGHADPDDLLALMDAAAPQAPIVLMGWSLGAGVSIVAATRKPGAVAGVIAEAPYIMPSTPASRVLRRRELPYRWNLPIALAIIGVRAGAGMRWRGFNRAVAASKLTCPLLVIHGDHDDICPIDDGKRIAGAASRGTFVEITGGGHVGLWSDEVTATECERAVAEWVKGQALEQTA